MNHTVPRRPHLAERAVDAARSAALAEAGNVRQAPVVAREATSLDALLVDGASPDQAHKLFTRPAMASPPEHAAPAPIARRRLEALGLASDRPSPGTSREQIALVREQVLRAIDTSPARPGHEAGIVLVTSARPGEGKSFVALNLAASMAEGAGRPIVLVDADGRAGSMTERLEMTGLGGLEALRSLPGRDPTSLLVGTEVPGLSILPHGSGEPVKGDAIAAGLPLLAARLPRHVFVVDAPACLETSIPGLLAAIAGQVLMVVQAERTQRAEVEAALDIVDACPNISLLLNRVMLTVSDSFSERMASPDGTADRAQS
ncbi:AAA family ATPase [Roseomonas sp. HJA6]|uniref:AAA family ATPase n=1 Tax=Roseomonas alba TaxID=2846776 RepID=A0ABS7A5G9_9PROT|nr:AAA family ATPase [Neoroseomonas alba]MBW6397533.1 AAA family ATPase [Neoroseomonas alba]